MALFSPYSEIVSARTLLTAGTPISPRLFLLNPRVVFAARVVVLDPPDYPISFIPYTGVTTGAYTDLKPGMTLLLGSYAGGDDYGRQRVRGPTTPATAISIFVGRSSQGTFDGELTLVDGAYLTVWDDRRVWAKASFIDEDGLIFKDGALEVGDRTTLPPPVAVMGAGFASTVDADTGVIAVLHNGQGSYATAAGATIVSWAWDIADGTLSSGTLSSDNITVTYPPGYRYVGLTVTDSNGKSATTERLVVADDLDHSLTFDGFAIESHDYTDAGVRLTIRALQDMPRATYPDGTPAIIFLRDQAAAADRTQMAIDGWLDMEDTTIGAGRNGLLRDTTLTILDVAARLDSLPGFPQSIADDDTRDVSEGTKTPDITWNYMVQPTMDLYMHYLWAWHSTALEVADFIWSGTGIAYQIAIKNSDGDSLWNQAWRIAQAMCPGFVLTCDQAGAIRVVPDPQLQDPADRTSVVQAAIIESDYSDIRFGYQRAPRVHWLRTGALLVQHSISFNAPVGGAAPTIYLPTVFSIAPGTTPGQGLGESENNEQLVISQAVLNSATGHKYARLNAATGLLTLTLIQDDGAPGTQTAWREIEPARKEWVTVDLGPEYAAQRGLTFASVRALPKEVSIRYAMGKSGLLRTVELTLEPETSGQPAKTVIKPVDIPAVGEDPPVVPPTIPPPDDGLIGGQDLVAGIGQFELYRTADFTTPSGSGGPTWEEVDLTGADEILTWVVDPFSPGYLTGVGTIDGWAATATAIYRIDDIFGATACNAILTFPTVALWRTVQASFGTYFVEGSNPWLICVSYYGSTGGHTGTWATYSIDGGATWAAEVLVSSEYDSGGASNPIGLYCSPKTPGYALTVAHVETADPATTGGYKSVDWGATWSLMDASDPLAPAPLWGAYDNADVYTQGGPSASAAIDVTASTSTGTDVQSETLLLAPPPNTKRLVVHGVYTGLDTRTGFDSAAGGLAFHKNGALTRTVVSSSSSGGGWNIPYSGDFVHEYTFSNWATLDWPGNSDDVISSPPAGHGPDNLHVRFTITKIASHGTGTVVVQEAVTVTVTEIELDDGTVYVPASGDLLPVNGSAGTIHIPWLDESESIYYYGALDRSSGAVYSLMRADEDVSPSAGYGISHGHFAVRSHDSDRQLVLAGVTDGTNQAVYKSSDAGDSWSAVISPAAGSVPYSAAWSGSLDDVLYIWGPAAYVGYSGDGGSSVDSRAGNLAALSATKLIGLAGGPTP